jgi:hypothetical protein
MSKTTANSLTKMILQKSKDKNSQKSILEVDYMTNHYLELADNKQDVIKNMIKDINKSVSKKKIANSKYFTALNDYLKGKLFYLALKDNKYFKMPDIEKVIDKNTLIEFVKEIESGQEFAWELIDNIKNDKLKDFFYGIFTYLYF